MAPTTVTTPVLGLRIPTDHNDGTDFYGGLVELGTDLDALASKPAASPGLRSLGNGALQAAAGNDPRFGIDLAASVGSRRTLGTGPLQAVAGNDSRFNDLVRSGLLSEMEGGTGVLTGNGTNTVQVVESHALGVVPQVVLAMPLGWPGYIFEYAAATSTQYFLEFVNLGGNFGAGITYALRFLLII